jgi:hypothetical protein
MVSFEPIFRAFASIEVQIKEAFCFNVACATKKSILSIVRAQPVPTCMPLAACASVTSWVVSPPSFYCIVYHHFFFSFTTVGI